MESVDVLAYLQDKGVERAFVVPALGPCWEWCKATNKDGYGVVGYEGKTWLVHRLALHLSGVLLDPRLEVDHLCRNHCCCNPKHLEQVTRRVNQLRGDGLAGRNARKDTCKYGHPFEEVKHANKRRICRVCEKRWQADWRERQRQKG